MAYQSYDSESQSGYYNTNNISSRISTFTSDNGSDRSSVMSDYYNQGPTRTARPMSAVSAISSISSFSAAEGEFTPVKLPNERDRRMRRRKMIIIGCIVINIFGIIISLLAYFVIIPAFIRKGIANNPAYIYPDSVTGTLASDNTINFSFRGELFLSGLPVPAKVDPGVFTLRTRDGTQLIDLQFPELNTSPSKRGTLDYNGQIKFYNVDRLAEVLRGVSEDGTSGELSELVATSTLGIAAFGVKWYPSLTVERRFPLQDITISRVIDAVLTGSKLPGALGNPRPEDPTLANAPRAPLPPIEIPTIAFTRISAVDQGLTVDTDINYKNFIPLATKIPAASILIKLMDTPIIKGRVRNFETQPNFERSRMTPSFDVLFASEPAEIAKKVQAAVGQFLNTGVLPISISGPVEWPGPIEFQGGREVPGTPRPGFDTAPWLTEMTKNFKIDIPVLQLVTILISRGDLLRNGLDLNRLANSISFKADLSVQNNQVFLPITLGLPGLNLLPSLKVDYSFGVDIAVLSAPLMNIAVSNFAIQPPANAPDTKLISLNITLSNSLFNPSVNGSIVDTINNVLNGNQAPMLTIRNLTVIPTSNNVNPCTWCERAFTNAELNIPLLPQVLLENVRRLLPGAPQTPVPGVPAPGVPVPGVPAPGVPAPGVPIPGTPQPQFPAPVPGVPQPQPPIPGVPIPGNPQPQPPLTGPQPGFPQPQVPIPGTPPAQFVPVVPNPQPQQPTF
ncbi:hypothetical protein BKA69DRAFT_1080399 [Paraphysoderma sedebokerense]|nr:hypothetical protein BKA69DRAFT_1080399 [Paraphysoderma sedebokerense]